MTTSIRTWGNSQGIYIPKKILSEAAIGINEPVELSVVDGAIMIRKKDPADRKRQALTALREIRVAHSGTPVSISDDYRKERNEYLDERYGK